MNNTIINKSKQQEIMNNKNSGYPPTYKNNSKIISKTRKRKHKMSKKVTKNNNIEQIWGLGAEHEFVIKMNMNNIDEYIKLLETIYKVKVDKKFRLKLLSVIKKYKFENINLVLPYVNHFKYDFVNMEITPNGVPMYEIKNLDYYNTNIIKIMSQLDEQKTKILASIKKEFKTNYNIDVNIDECDTGAGYLVHNKCSESNYVAIQDMNRIICTDYKNIKIQDDTTGSYHFWITLPHKKSDSSTNIDKVHQKAILLLQTLEPLFVSIYGSCDPRINKSASNKHKTYLKGSYRGGTNAWAFYGTSNPINYNKYSLKSRVVNSITIPNTKIGVTKFYNDIKNKIKSGINASNYINYPVFSNYKWGDPVFGSDFRRKTNVKGFEFRIWDHFPQKNLPDVLKIVYLVATHAFNIKDDHLELPISLESWNTAMRDTLLEGYTTKLKKNYSSFISKQLKIKLDHCKEPEMMLNNIISILYKKVKKNNNSKYWLLTGENIKNSKKPKITNINKISQLITK
tara:strand:- start:331 stop:1866 length:1536 start_codon:yes stop_codon:yes gene_type:complete